MFYCGRIAFTVFQHADIKGVRQRLTSTASLDDGYCEATIPVVPRDVKMGWARETAFASCTYICAFYVEIANIHGVKLKMSYYNRD